MGATTAKIVVHPRNDLIAGRFWIRNQETIGLENHAGRAKPALKGIVLDKGPLIYGTLTSDILHMPGDRQV